MEIVMNKGEIICIDGDARELEITSFSGTLWITQTGDPNDYLLYAGDCFKITRKGRVAITACQAAQAHFSTAISIKRPATPWRVQLQTA